jgi:sarcosine oxidase subunit gamma
MLEPALRSLPVLPSRSWLKSLPPAMRFVLHGRVEARQAAAAVWGAGFSEDACRSVTLDERSTLWLGPDEYLLLGTDASDPEATRDALQRALHGIPCALIDVSHRQFGIEISGPRAAIILNGACPLDLDPAQFPVGMCTRTVLAKADIMLWRTRPDAFHLEAWRSFAGYVGGLLCEIAREFYPE